MEIEIDNECFNFKCPDCNTGLWIFFEEDWSGEFDMKCPKCGTKHKINRMITYKYEKI